MLPKNKGIIDSTASEAVGVLAGEDKEERI